MYGKTGTAQHAGKEDQSWYMCYVGDPQRPIVIAVTVEQGGFGAETAAPIARLMASQWFGKRQRSSSPGARKTLMSVSRSSGPIAAGRSRTQPPRTRRRARCACRWTRC